MVNKINNKKMVLSMIKKLMFLASLAMTSVFSSYASGELSPTFDMRSRAEIISGIDYLKGKLEDKEDLDACNEFLEAIKNGRVTPPRMLSIISKGSAKFGEYLNEMVVKGVFIGEKEDIDALKDHLENGRSIKAACKMIQMVNSAK